MQKCTVNQIRVKMLCKISVWSQEWWEMNRAEEHRILYQQSQFKKTYQHISTIYLHKNIFLNFEDEQLQGHMQKYLNQQKMEFKSDF